MSGAVSHPASYVSILGLHPACPCPGTEARVGSTRAAEQKAAQSEHWLQHSSPLLGCVCDRNILIADRLNATENKRTNNHNQHSFFNLDKFASDFHFFLICCLPSSPEAKPVCEVGVGLRLSAHS